MERLVLRKPVEPQVLGHSPARTPHPEIAAQFPTSPKGEVELRARRKAASPWGEAEIALAISGEGSARAACSAARPIKGPRS